ncbi:hypothetical protein PybrP1_003679 [[Pythium] brassicae (nom. inval.)]|nr:hypothetical protein PybrP1_003679 [[Pythium] brassicae (nom. inval.)]
MGKAARQRLDDKKRQLFATHRDERSAEQRALARATLDALQQKLEDDALREDGFFFIDGVFAAARRPRTSSGMKMRSFEGHVRGVKALVIVRLAIGGENSTSSEPAPDEELTSVVVTFGLDRYESGVHCLIGVWDFGTAKSLATLDVSGHDANFICGTAARLPGTAGDRRLRFAFATLATPMIHSFDLASGRISHPSGASGRGDGTRAFLSGPTTPAYCAAHQQQIASMELSPHANVLATCSWDSTCMIWQIHETTAAAAVAPVGEAGGFEPPITALRLVLMQILPVHDLGASCARFVSEGRQLITAGDCTVKLWELTETSPEDAPSSQLEAARVEWEAAIPFSLSVQKSLALLVFDETLTALVPNHSWTQQHAGPNGGAELTLLVSGQSPASPSLFARQQRHDQVKQQHESEATTTQPTTSESGSATAVACAGEADSRKHLEPVGLLLSSPVESMHQRQQQAQESTERGPLGRGDTDASVSPSAEARSNSNDSSKLEDSKSNDSAPEGASPELSLGMLSADDTAFLEQYYRNLARFDFAELLNPTIPFRTDASSSSNEADPVGKRNQSDDAAAAPRSIFSFAVEPPVEENNAAISATTTAIATKELVWTPLQPDANGAFLTTFYDRNAREIFSAHTSRITSCAVSTDLCVLVTVALDKALKFWSLASAQVLETVSDAHTAPITCCALTTRQTRQNPQRDGMLVATGAKDNVVKVWHRNCLGEQPTECLYSFAGHYDTPTCCAFDSTGVFLISAGDDTNVIVWRVVPSSPDQPKPLALVTVDTFAIAVSWEVPLANGSPLLHYVVRTRQTSSPAAGGFDSAAIPDMVVLAKYTSKTVEGLQPGVQYTLEIAAVNAIGSSPFSVATRPIETLASVPSRVEKPPQHSDCRATRIRLSWKQPPANGAAIQAFTIRCLPENSAFVPALELSVPVADLERVAAAAAATTASRELSNGGVARAKKQSATGSTKATGSVATSGVDTAASVEAEVDAAAATVLASHTSNKKPKRAMTMAVTTRKRTPDANKPGASSAPAPPSTDVYFAHTVGGLWPGEIYQFVAAAENRCGLGAFSYVSDYVKMESTAPDAPAAPVVVDVQRRQVGVEWAKPRCNGSEVLQYTLEWVQDMSLSQAEAAIVLSEPAGDGATVPNAHINESTAPLRVDGLVDTTRSSIVLLARSIAGTRYTLTGLDPGKPLRVWLSASNLIDNKICTSALSPPSDVAVTLCDVPDAPARPELLHLTPQPSGHTLVLAFTPPKGNGLAIESYDVLLFCEEEQFGVSARRVCRDFKLCPSECGVANSNTISSSSSSSETIAFAIRKLRGATFYGVQLCALNALGAGPMSECSVLVSTRPATVPARMREPPVLASDVEPTKASIAWGIPENDGGAPLVAFHVQYSMQPTDTVLTDDIDEYEGYESSTSGVVRYKALFDQEVAVYNGRELLATFLRPKSTYRFRVASSNAVGRSAFSKKSAPVHTPSLVEFTIARSSDDRAREDSVHPGTHTVRAFGCLRFALQAIWLAHSRDLASYSLSLAQKRYRAWKRSVAQRKHDDLVLRIALRDWHILMDQLLAERLRGGSGSGSGADDMPPLPTAAARLAPPNIRALILEKEKELHDINEYRIRTLEGLLRDKESAANGYKQKFAKLQEDFKYNLKGRDEELALYDTNFASLKSALRDRDADVSELKVQLADAQAELKAQQSRGRDQDTFVQQKLKDARAQMDGARWQFDDELRRCRDEAEQAKRKAERRLREQEEDLEAQRREISVAFDEMTRQREVEFKAALDQALGHSRDLELRLKATARESDASRDRLEEAKLKMDNLQQLLHEAEKERKAAEWQLADVRAAKDARIRELEAGAAQLQDVKQALLDEYEAKMAELLQSLHAVESAFVQQKTQYDEELQQHLRRKDDELQSHSLRLESKIVSLTAKLREHEEKYDAAQAELKQLHWDGDAQLLEKDRDVERLKSDLQDLEDEKHALVADSKQQLWQSERALLSLQEKLKDAAVQLQVQREKEKVLRRELAESVETHEELKREIVTLNLRWENKWQDHEQEVSGRRELRERELQHAKDRLIAEKQATEERLVHAENELQRLRTEVFALRTDARIAESFGSAHRRESAPHSRSNGDRAVAAPSPLWSDDHGELSPLVGMSPLLTATPPPATGGGAASATVASLDALQLENAKLRGSCCWCCCIRQMSMGVTCNSSFCC